MLMIERLLTGVRHLVRNLLHRDSVEHDLDLEIDSYLEMLIEEKLAAGISPHDARRQARLELGGRDGLKEQVRDVRIGSWVASVARDLQFAIRTLGRRKVLTGVIVLSLGLGLGATSAVFSFADALLLRPLSVPDPMAIVTVGAEAPGDGTFRSGRMSYPNYRDLRNRSKSFDGLVAYESSPLSFARSRDAVREIRRGALVSDNYFRALGVQPALGRGFALNEGKVPGRDAIVVLAHDFWHNTLGADRSLLDGIVVINGIDFTVIGVAPSGFYGNNSVLRPAFYLPLSMGEQLDPSFENPLENRTAHWYVEVKGRLAPGASVSSAQVELATLWQGLAQQYPEVNRNRTITVRSEFGHRVRRSPPDAIVTALLSVLAVVVLLIACSNVSNLLLGRATSRVREMALRLSLGSSRARLVRQLLTESFVLALLGTVAGIGVAYAGVQLFRTLPTPDEVTLDPQLDARVLMFSLGLGVLSVAVFGLVPAWRSLRTQLAPSLNSSGRGTTSPATVRCRNALVVVQVALSTVLLFAACFLLDGFRQLLVLDPGFRTDGIMLLATNTELVGYSHDQTRAFYRELADRAEALPGVENVALARSIPLGAGGHISRTVTPEGYEFPDGQDAVSVQYASVDENYFDVMRVGLLRGRSFAASDTQDTSPVAIVNVTFAEKYWPNQDPIGKRLRLGSTNGPWAQVVGLAKTGKYFFVTESPAPFIYLPFAQRPHTTMHIIAEVVGPDAAAIAGPLRGIVRDLDPDLPVFNVQPLSSLYRRSAITVPRKILELVSTLGGFGLMLALIGLYALISYSVAQRTREIGIRIALGASSSDVLKQVIRQGLALATIGLCVGGLVSIAAKPLLGAVVAGLKPPNLVVYALVPAILLLLTLASSYLPARRASLVDPNQVLRAE